MRSKCRIQFGVLCSASSGAQDTNLDSAEYNLGSYAVQASAQDPKLYSSEYNLVSYAPELALQRTLNCILHFCIYSSLLLKFLILCGHHRWSILFSRSHIHPTVASPLGALLVRRQELGAKVVATCLAFSQLNWYIVYVLASPSFVGPNIHYGPHEHFGKNMLAYFNPNWQKYVILYSKLV